jgi:hypothetical protein
MPFIIVLNLAKLGTKTQTPNTLPAKSRFELGYVAGFKRTGVGAIAEGLFTEWKPSGGFA